MKALTKIALLLAAPLWIAGCGAGDNDGHDHDDHDGHDHSTHDHDHDHGPGETGSDDHGETNALAPAHVGDLEVQLTQGFGAIKAGKESQLLIKLPYSDNGQTRVRAWIGTEDRTLSYVGKGDYLVSQDTYDLHATAPAPLPDSAMWWIEIEKPDGTKALGSSKTHIE